MACHGCLKTLANSPRKAVLVRSFHLDWRTLTTDVESAHLQMLGDAFLGMSSLKFLYLRLWRHQSGPVQLVLKSILRCGYKLDIEPVRAESSFI
jgi:hypothetical protein